MEQHFILIELDDPFYGVDKACTIVEERLEKDRLLGKSVRVKNFRRVAGRQEALDRLWDKLEA